MYRRSLAFAAFATIAGLPGLALADYSISTEVSGTRGGTSERFVHAETGFTARTYASGVFDNWKPGPTGSDQGATGYNYGGSAWGEAGPGFLRSAASVQMLSSYLEYGDRPLIRARAAATGFYRDVQFTGDDAQPAGSAIATKLRLHLDGNGNSFMHTNGGALDATWDNAFGHINFSVNVYDIDTQQQVAEMGGQWHWAYDLLPYPSKEYTLYKYGDGLLENWNETDSLFELPFNAVVGHTYQIAIGLTVESRMETDGFMYGQSIGLFDHTVQLDATPFALPAGVTANSEDAGVADNAYAGAPASGIPEPTALALHALAAPAFFTRRRMH